MKTSWMIKTHGDPLGSVHHLLHNVWQQNQLDGMLVPLNGDEATLTQLRLLDDPQQLNRVNPFKPLMTLNVARSLPELVQEHPEALLGVLLRPCEMRALIEMVKHDSLDVDHLVTICVDCLGTLPADEYEWRAARKGAQGTLTHEALQFARQGGLVPYRYRPACQTCFSPEAWGGDLNIQVLGLPVRQFILVTSRDQASAEALGLDRIADGLVDEMVVARREQSVAKILERRHRARERVTQSLAASLPSNVNQIVTMFEQCESCRACLDACPICAVDFPQRGADGRYSRDGVERWLVSCDGCGMCEQACPEHRPLTAIFGHMREQLAEATGYKPGHSMQEPLPIVMG